MPRYRKKDDLLCLFLGRHSELGISQATVAKRLGIDRSTYNRMLHGASLDWPLRTIYSVAECLELIREEIRQYM